MFENFHRLYITIQYCGHLVLLEELHKHLPKEKNLLFRTLISSQIHNKLSRLRVKKIINQEQWDILYPNDKLTDSDLFDITLCFILLRNICPSFNIPDNGWNQSPTLSDKSLEANLVRLKLFRNDFSHSPWNWFLSDETFLKKWDELEIILKDLGYEHIPAKISLTDLKTGPLDTKCHHSIIQQKIINEMLRLEQKKMKVIFGSGTLVFSFIWLIISIVFYQYSTPGSWYRYYACSFGQLHPASTAKFEFIPTRDPYGYVSVNGIEFTFKSLMLKTEHLNYIPLKEGYRYYLNIDRCAYGGIQMADLNTGRKAIRGADIFAIDFECKHVFYYNEIIPEKWVHYRSSKMVKCYYS